MIKDYNVMLYYYMTSTFKYVNRYMLLLIIIKIFLFILTSIMIIWSFYDFRDWHLIVNVSIVIIMVFFDNFLKNEYQNKYEFASYVRNVDLYSKSLSYKISAVEESYLNIKINEKSFYKNNSKNGSSYFFSNKETGSHKLIDNIQENVFWTGILMRNFSKYLKITMYFLVFFVMVCFGSLILIFFNTDSIGLKIMAQLIILLVSILFSSDIFLYYKSYKDRSLQLINLDLKIEKIKESVRLHETMIICNEYNEILSKSYPVPPFIYRKYKKRLNAIWKTRIKTDYVDLISMLTRTINIASPWVLTGSSRLLFEEDKNMIPSDIDLLTTSYGAYEIQEIFKKYMVEEVESKQKDKMKSTFGYFILNNIKIEIIGDIENEIDGKYQPHPNWQQEIIFLLVNGMNIPVFSLEYELRINKMLGRCKQVLLLEELLNNKK